MENKIDLGKTPQVTSMEGSPKAKVLFDNRISEKFLTSDELAEKLNVSVHTVRKWRKQEKIPYYKLGFSLRFKVSDVLTSLKGGNYEK